MASREKSVLEVRDVSKSFGPVQALSKVTFDVIAGEVHGLVGENGAGKSTLMAVASGAISASSGEVEINGQVTLNDPELARELGLAIVRQHPALMPDLSVAENLYLGVPPDLRPSETDLAAWSQTLLERWGPDLTFGPNDRVETLSPESWFVIEIVKALACAPKVLVLDEPTEHLAAEDVERLFERIRAVSQNGAGVVYISHRIRDVQMISDRLTVLKDGASQGTFDASGLDENDIVQLIVGGALDDEFPDKATQLGDTGYIAIEGLTGRGFTDVSLSMRKGEILGLAGISDNGQEDLLRALAGLGHVDQGGVTVDGSPAKLSSPVTSRASGFSFLPGDRHREGLFAHLSVRENFSSRSLMQDARLGFMRPNTELVRTEGAIRDYMIKTHDPETYIGMLSGGNQQKTVLASALACDPKVFLVHEPTQGVDVGARAEIYRLLRAAANRGTAIIVVSSDAIELSGICDRVAVFSRGKVVEELAENRVTEEAIVSASLTSTSVRDTAFKQVGALWKFASGDAAPLLVVGLAVIILGLAANSQNEFYFTWRNITGMLVLTATLALVGYAQQVVMLIGGFDLSVGPQMGLVQVVASFFLIADAGASMQVLGWGLMLVAALGVGFVNWLLIEPLRLHPMVATLATYMGVQAVSLVLRPSPEGMISWEIMDAIGYRIGPIPVMFVVALVIAIGLEFFLFRRRHGFVLRALGSDPDAARKAGINGRRVRLFAFLGCSTLAFVAGASMMEQVGIGDPRAGLNYTLASVAVVVIGGGSMFGARGSFLGVLLASFFIVQVNTVTNFMGLSFEWQSYLLAGAIIMSVAFYSKCRELAVAS